MNNIRECIQKCNDFKQLEEIESIIDQQKKVIIESSWRNLYERTGDAFLTIAEFINELYESNFMIDGISELEAYIYANPKNATLSRITTKACESGIIIKTCKLEKFICAACECENCSSCMNNVHCNGYTCSRCKSENFAGYDWECEE